MGEKEGEILRAARVTLKDMADALGVPHATVRNWSVGRVAVPVDARAQLAAFLERRGGELTRLAAELREAGEG
jgi:DNA-binding transcriptional regulator YiaG